MRETLAFITCVLIWGSTWYAIKFQVGDVPPSWSVAYRFALASLMLFIYCLATKKKLRFSIRDHVWFMGIGMFLFSLNYIMVYYGTIHLTSGLVAVAFSLLGIFNIFNTRLFLKARIDPYILAVSSLGVIGLALIFSKEISALSLSDKGVLGLTFCLTGSFLASLGNTVAASTGARNLPLMSFNAWGMLYGTLVNVLFAFANGDPMVFDDRLSYWVSMVFLSAFGTVLAFTLYLWLISRIGVAKAGYVAVIMPMVALVISTIFEGYIWTPMAAVGAMLVVGGNILVAKRRQAKTS